MTSLSPSRALPLAVVPLLIPLLGGCTDEPPPQGEVVRPVKAMQIADFAGFIDQGFPGKAKATQEVNLSFDVQGTLVERPVNVGDRLEEGQLVAKLDQRAFLAKVQAAEAELAKDTANFERGKQLVEQDFISKTQFDELKAKKDIADSALQLARKALSDSTLVAPFEGVISRLYVKNFQAVMPKQPVARLLDSSRIEFVVNIPEQFISFAPQVRNLKVRFDAFPDVEIPAEIKEISNEATEATRTYPVNLIMDQPEGIKILPGMAGVAYGERQAASASDKSVQIPVTALFAPDDSGQSYVWVIDEGKTAQRRAVTVERLSDTGVRISEGLQPGEWIAVAGVHFLTEGQEVRILDAPED